MASDLSSRCDRAMQRAVRLAQETGAELEVLTVVDETSFEATTRQSETVAAEALSQQVAHAAPSLPIEVSRRVIVGLDFEDIIKRSEEFDADLIVLGTHRHQSRQLFQGTTAERVIRYGLRPVLVVSRSSSGPYRRVIVATDLSAHGVAAIEAAARLATGGTVWLLHVVHRPFIAFLGKRDQDELRNAQQARASAELDRVIERLKHDLDERAPKFEIVLTEGDVLETVHAEINRLDPDLLAIGTHGRSGIAHAVIGSVAEQLLADCPIDVLTVKARA